MQNIDMPAGVKYISSSSLSWTGRDREFPSMNCQTSFSEIQLELNSSLNVLELLLNEPVTLFPYILLESILVTRLEHSLNSV